MEIGSRLDITRIFCEVDDFCQMFERHWQDQAQLPSILGERLSSSRMKLSEIITIVIAFHGSGFRTFKEFYTLCVLPHWGKAFPRLVSYNRFVELMLWCLMMLSCFAHTRKGTTTGIAFIDSTPIDVCHACRAHANKVFKGLVAWGKNSVGWHFGFKLHLIINDKGELLAFKLTAANTDDRKPVPEMAEDLIGKLFGDRLRRAVGNHSYISQPLFEQLYQRGLQFISKPKKNMKQRLIKVLDKVLLRKHAAIESINDQLKNICQIEHSRHRSFLDFLVNLLAGLVAYSYFDKSLL